MTQNPQTPSTSAGAWGLRYPGLVMGKGGKNEVKEFTGMWPLKPGTDLVAFTKVLAPGGAVNPPGESFAPMMTKLGLIRTARWFVARTQDFEGYTLFFVSQFDGSLDKYFDDFVLNGKDNLAARLGQLYRLSDRSRCDSTRRCGVYRARSDQNPGLLRCCSEPQSRSDL